MTSLDDTVDTIEGCGPKRKEIFAKHKIYTIRDLLDSTAIIPKINMMQLRSRAREMLQGGSTPGHTQDPNKREVRTIKDHSWHDRSMHVLNNQSLVRVVIGDMVVEPHRIVLAVTYTIRKRKKMRFASPYQLLLLHVLWQTHEVVSSDTENEEEDILTVTPSAHPELYPLVCAKEEVQHLEPVERDALSFLCHEINGLIRYVQGGNKTENE